MRVETCLQGFVHLTPSLVKQTIQKEREDMINQMPLFYKDKDGNEVPEKVIVFFEDTEEVCMARSLQTLCHARALSKSVGVISVWFLLQFLFLSSFPDRFTWVSVMFHPSVNPGDMRH